MGKGINDSLCWRCRGYAHIAMMSSLNLNPMWKTIAKNLSKGCERCGKPRLISIFDAYVAGEKPDCFSCSAAYVGALPLIKRVFSNTNLKEDDLKKLMDDVLLRRSMLNVVRGIGRIGPRTYYGLRSASPMNCLILSVTSPSTCLGILPVSGSGLGYSSNSIEI